MEMLRHRRDPWAIPLLFLLGIVMRAADLKRPFRGIYSWNEAYYSIVAVNFSHYGLTRQVGPDGPLFTSNPLVPWMIAASFHYFGQTEIAARLPFFLLSLISLAAIYGIARAQYPNRPAVARWCLLLAATMPGIVFFSRNVQLDGPMTAFGLVAIWLAILFRNSRRPALLLPSLLALALCLTLKYTGALMIPAWWIALGLSKKTGTRDKLCGALLTLTAMLPAFVVAHWVSAQQIASHAAVHGLTTHNYFLRFSEWRISAFRDALLATWATLPNHWGRILWFPFLVALPWLLPRVRTAMPSHWLIPAMILPWYLQIAYPVSWVTNEYYDYFGLYGAALGLGVLMSHLQERLGAQRYQPQWLFAAALIIISNMYDYKSVFHVSYYPYDIVKERTPFVSARQVRQLNTLNAPVLCDQSETMFYAGSDPNVTSYSWWGDHADAFTQAVRSRKYHYVTVEYLPPIDAVNALSKYGYQQIAPGAWVLNAQESSLVTAGFPGRKSAHRHLLPAAGHAAEPAEHRA